MSTGPAARSLKAPVHPNTLWRWWQEGLVTPATTTAKGQARWDVEDLQRQIDALLVKQAEDHERKRAQKREPPPRSTFSHVE